MLISSALVSCRHDESSYPSNSMCCTWSERRCSKYHCILLAPLKTDPIFVPNSKNDVVAKIFSPFMLFHIHRPFMCATLECKHSPTKPVPHCLTSKAALLEMWPPPSSLYEILFHCLYNICLFNLLVTLAGTCMQDILYVWMLDRVLFINTSLNQKQWYCYLPSLNLDVIFFLPILGSKKNHYYPFWLFLPLFTGKKDKYTPELS